MPNELDEITGPTNAAGRDVQVIDRQIPVTIGVGSLLFEISLWVIGPIPGLILLALGALPQIQGLGLVLAGFLPGLIFIFMKVNALAGLRKLQQQIQANASEIDNYLEQRVVILSNLVRILDRAIDLDKDVMKAVSAYRAGAQPMHDAARLEHSQRLDGLMARINVAFEAYPNLQAHAAIADAMRQNSYLQKEITAARTLYNDSVMQWNQEIFSWPTSQIVAARQGYTTRIPFIASQDMRTGARRPVF